MRETHGVKPDLTPFLGERVIVHIDRPLGSVHPRYPLGGPYPINYGYLPDTVSGDGHSVDAYVVGLDEPVIQAEGVVIAIVIRAGDLEDKLVVAGDDRSYTPAEIRDQIEFQERYFDSTIVTVQGKGR